MERRISLVDNYGMVLAGVDCATLLAKAISDGVSTNGDVVLDLDGVLAMDNAFGDACFGDLIVKKGPEWLCRSVSLVNVNPGPMERMLARTFDRWAPDGLRVRIELARRS